jgi:hypothetical protein
MTTTYVDAQNEIYSVLFVAWNNGASAIAGYVPEIRWIGAEKAPKIVQDKFWASASIKTVISQQSTLSNCEGIIGQKKYTETGLLFIQIFAPMSVGSGMLNGKKLATLARNAYRGVSTESGVWFRNARINDLEPDDGFYRWNVIAEFEYDELY